MAWAVHSDDLRPVHVAMLGRDATGLACECRCPGCGSLVQAVNVGRAAAHYLKPGVTRPFFRHHQTPQGDGCKQSVARLATLHLLFERDEIALPAPRAVKSAQGLSGQVPSEAIHWNCLLHGRACVPRTHQNFHVGRSNCRRCSSGRVSSLRTTSLMEGIAKRRRSSRSNSCAMPRASTSPRNARALHSRARDLNSSSCKSAGSILGRLCLIERVQRDRPLKQYVWLGQHVAQEPEPNGWGCTNLRSRLRRPCGPGPGPGPWTRSWDAR